jgi:hypothetical protein
VLPALAYVPRSAHRRRRPRKRHDKRVVDEGFDLVESEGPVQRDCAGALWINVEDDSFEAEVSGTVDGGVREQAAEPLAPVWGGNVETPQ